MPYPAIHSSPFSQGNPPSPANGPEEHNDPGVWKRRYLELSQRANAQNPSKRKEPDRKEISLSRLGRGIRKVVFICGEIKYLVSDSDKHCAYLEDPDDIDLNNEFEGLPEDEVRELRRSWERSHTAVQILNGLIPNFWSTIDEESPEMLSKFYTELQQGADNARSDDLLRIRGCIAEWLNVWEPTPSPLLDYHCRKNRGLAHDLTGRLLCPIDFDWDNLVIRAKLRAGDEEFDWLCSYHARCFYAKYKGNVKNLETGYLKSVLLVKVYKSIFTSPSSAKDVSEEEDDTENLPPAKTQRTLSGKKAVRRNVATKVNLNNKVTPRTIAYAAVQLHFNLQTASSWSQVYGGFDYEGLYNYVVDFFEDTPGPATKKSTQELLKWWTKKIFPVAPVHTRTNTAASRKALKQQREAREQQGAS